MSTFNRKPLVRPTSTRTHEGGGGWDPSPFTQLKMLAACLYADEDSFYESKQARMDRYVALVHRVASKPNAFRDFMRDLVEKHRVRNAAIVAAAEMARVAGPDHPAMARRVIDQACVRADAPTELLSYWLDTYGKPIPQYVKRGLSDAARRLYTEKSVVKYDSERRKVRMGDLIELCRPKPGNEAQSELFRLLLSQRRHGFQARFNTSLLPTLASYYELWRMPEVIRGTVPTAMLDRAGMTWEQYTAWLPGPMGGSKWETVLPRMPYMALIRNLRNFDKAGISDEAALYVADRLSDPGEIRSSLIFPYHLLLALSNTNNELYRRNLGWAMDAASENVTPMDNSLILVDMSGSMNRSLSKQSSMTRKQVAALQAVSLYRVSNGCEVVGFGTNSRRIPMGHLHAMDQVQCILNTVGLGHRTHGHSAILNHFKPHHERVVIFTDDQMHDSGYVDVSHVPWIFTFNCASEGPVATYGRGRVHMAGFTNEVFEMAANMAGGLF